MANPKLPRAAATARGHSGASHPRRVASAPGKAEGDEESETEGALDAVDFASEALDHEALGAALGAALAAAPAAALTRVPSRDEAELVDPDEAKQLLPTARAWNTDKGTAAGGSGSGPALRDPVARMMAEVRRYPRLSEADERELGRAVRERGDLDAARRLVVHNLRLVVSIAHQYRRAWANILDLFQEGSVGLMEAVKRWEPSLGPRFGSYAAYWIRAYVLKFLMTNSRLIHVGNTRAGRKLFFRLERERQKLLAAGFEATPKLLAAKLEVDEKDLDEVGRHLDSREISFDPAGSADSDEGYSLSERIPLAQASPEQTAATSEMSGALHEVMEDFFSGLTDERERVVWRDHLAAADPLPLGELGARFGVSKQRMGQIAESLKKRFRERILSRMGPEIQTDWLD
ncbi:MAG: sigma-70 family RNA polymerase sigma factor [Myxococcales bacterium]